MMKENIEEEFDCIKNNIYYLDWNTISYLKNPYEIKNNEKLKIEVLCLNHILLNFLDPKKFVIPYSNAHFLDIKNGAEEYKKLSLDFLQTISGGWQISESFQNRELLGLDKILDIHENYSNYREYLNEMDESEGELQKALNPFFIIVKSFIQFTSDVQDIPSEKKTELNDLINCLFPMDNEESKNKLLRINKDFKLNLKDLNGGKIKFPLFDSVKSKFPSKNVKEIVDLCIKKSDLPFSSLQEITNKFEIIKDTSALSLFNNEINKLYFLAEFISVSTENLRSKTAFQGIVNDQFHLSYGLRCKYFITEDNALYKKGIFIRDWIHSNTKIFKIDEFNRFLLKKVSLVLKNDENNLGKKEFNYQFHDSRGDLIKEYRINIEE